MIPGKARTEGKLKSYLALFWTYEKRPDAPILSWEFVRWLISLAFKNYLVLYFVLYFALQIILGLVQRIHFQWLRTATTNHPISVAVTFTGLVVGLGALASYWKRKALRSYALMEVMFGALLGFNVLLHLAPDFGFAKLFAVASAIYVIARGFNNLSDARLAARV